jgi:hypothetical protein
MSSTKIPTWPRPAMRGAVLLDSCMKNRIAAGFIGLLAKSFLSEE